MKEDPEEGTGAGKLRKGRILAIDDNEDNLSLLEAILADYEVVCMATGQQGLNAIKQSSPDLVLLDIQMPGMDGFKVLETLKGNVKTRQIPVILLTAAYRDAFSIERGLDLGAAEYLTKPIDAEELRVRVRGVLRLARAERELENLRRDFSSMLLHDMRTPLESVRLALSLLGRIHSDERTAELVGMATGGLAEIGEMVESLVEGHRLAHGDLNPDLQGLELNAIAAEVAGSLGLLATQRGMRVIDDVPTGLRILGDARLLVRILSNLVGNALKYAEVGDVRLGAVTAGDRVIVEVVDVGPGMEADIRDHAFDRFFKGAHRHDQLGYGLGLAFCKQAVEAHGGEIGIDSSPGKGTRVWFSLPAAPAGPEPGPRTA